MPVPGQPGARTLPGGEGNETLIRITALALLATPACAAEAPGTDWRATASTDDKVERLVDVMPGASSIMLAMGDRYRNLY